MDRQGDSGHQTQLSPERWLFSLSLPGLPSLKGVDIARDLDECWQALGTNFLVLSQIGGKPLPRPVVFVQVCLYRITSS